MSLSYLLDALRARVPSDSAGVRTSVGSDGPVQPSDSRASQLPSDTAPASRVRPPVADFSRVHTTLA